jgi:hypothetical protein
MYDFLEWEIILFREGDMKYAVETDGSLRVLDLNINEISIIRNAIAEFQEQPEEEIKEIQAPGMARKINEDIDKNCLQFKTLKRFSKWCNTNPDGPRYPRSMPYAQKICSALFDGELIPRLSDDDKDKKDKVNQTYEKEYKEFLLKLKEKGILLNTTESQIQEVKIT